MKSLNSIRLVIIHALFGLVVSFVPVLVTAWAILFLAYSLHHVLNKRNSDGFAAIAAGYIVGLEILARMLDAGLPWEFGKYAVVGILLAAFFSEKRRNPVPAFALVYFLFLLPSILVVSYPDVQEFRGQLSFNLSGPLCLAVSVLYFYKRQFSIEMFRQVSLAVLLGIVATMVTTFMRIPSLETIQFLQAANFATSGGFGPNQVSTLLGAGFLLLGLGMFLKFSITGNVLLDRGIGLLAMVMGILTFSRGGVLVPSLILFLCAIVMAVKSDNPRQFIRAVSIVSVVVVIAGVGYFIVNNLTKDALTDRYTQTTKTAHYSEFDESLQVEGVDLSGRESIFLADLFVFLKYPILGVGPGGAVEARKEIGGVIIAAHTEQSRMLSEHGLYGIVALILLMVAPYRAFNSAPNLQSKILVLSFTLFCFLTMIHSAMRMALPSFFYGLGFIILTPGLSNPLMKQGNS